MIIHIYHKVQQTTKEHSRLQQGLIITLRCVRLDRPAARGWWQRSNSGRHNVDFLYFGFDGYIYCKTLFLLQQLSQKKSHSNLPFFFIITGSSFVRLFTTLVKTESFVAHHCSEMQFLTFVILWHFLKYLHRIVAPKGKPHNCLHSFVVLFIFSNSTSLNPSTLWHLFFHILPVIFLPYTLFPLWPLTSSPVSLS